jgi:hypothetical protein
MNILTRLIISAVALGLSSQVAAQAEVEIEWEKPEKYSDVRPSNEPRKRFREATFQHINEYMNKLALALPENQTLLMKVSDLDLAGQVWPASFVGFGHSASDVRIIKNIDIPRISFSYQLVDESGEVVQQAEVKLKDMSFLDRSNRFFKSESLRYEKSMLQRWFIKEFGTHIAKKVANKERASKEPVNSTVSPKNIG